MLANGSTFNIISLFKAVCFSDGNSIEILIGILLLFLGGLADLTKAIQVNDQMVEVNGHPIQGKSLNDVILLLQNSHDQEQGVKLKLARLISIPERPELYSLVNRRNSGESIYAKKPPLPSPSPNRLVSNC